MNIGIAILSATALILLLVFIIIISAINYRVRRQEYQRNLKQVKEEQEREILKASLEVREQTLQNVAQEIHDNVGQVLSLVKLNLNVANQSIIDASIKEKLTDSVELTSKAIQDLRDLSKSINSEYIKNQQLSTLISALLDQLEKSGGYSISLEKTGIEKPLKPEDRIIVYRMIQEVTNNILKHAEASSINMHLIYESQNKLTIIIIDNGKGFEINSEYDGNGFHNLKYRCKLINAILKIESQINRGTSITIKLKTYE